MGFIQLQRCPECPSLKMPECDRKTPVPWDGDDDAEIMLVGEAPGREENNRHRPFVGKAGEEFNTTYLLKGAGLSRSSVYVTNACKCHWADSSDAPPEAVYRSCAEFHLRRELAKVQPKYVVLMGSVAASLLNLDVDLEHGMMHEDVELLGHRCHVYVTYHPALGLHMGNKMQDLLDDFARLRLYLRGRLAPLKSACPNPIYERLTTAADIKDAIYGMGYEDGSRIAIDTESIKRWRGFKSTIRYIPDRLTFCVEPPYSFMVMRSDEGACQQFAREVVRFRRVYMHNSPHDEGALLDMDIHVPPDPVYDTMSGAYHFASLPKGLKALGYRLAGIRMTSFDEIVVPYGYELALEYLNEARLHQWPLPEQQLTGEQIIRNCPTCKGKGKWSVGRGKARRVYECDCNGGKIVVDATTRHQSLNQAIDRVFTDLTKGPVKIWERWESWTDKEHLLPAVKALIAKFDAIPLPSIDYVPEEKAKIYACGDALVTRIIGPMIHTMNATIRRSVRG